jgi:hemerythrin
MANLQWNESHSVHVQQLDDQHKLIFDAVNALAGALRKGYQPDRVQSAIQQLAQSMRTHIRDEEELLRKAGCPQLDTQRTLHARLLAHVEQLRRDLYDGREVNTAAALGFLRQRIVAHIQKSDKACSAQLNAQGIV